jgi:plasmid maintenance system killer protein
LWGYFKHKAFETCPPDLDTLKQKIVEEINAIQAATQSRVMENVVTRVHECIKRDGQHLSSIIFKK